MTKTRLLTLAAALCTSVALPASAQPGYDYNRPGSGPWDRIGSVDFSFRPDRETAYGNFGGRVEALSFVARNSPVRCNQITATFNNGRTRELYRGLLPRGREVVVDLPGASRMIRRIDFDCRSMQPRIARVDINADIGQYRADWRRSPDWNRVWSRMFNWDNDQLVGGPVYGGDRLVTGQLDPAGWITLGTQIFQGPYEQRTTVEAFDGRGVDRIAIRPIDNDARCRFVDVTFEDGSARRMPITDGENLDEGRLHQFSLGGFHDVDRVDLACQAADGGRVAMQVMARG